MQTSRIFGLDLMRATAILSVVYSHGHPIVATHLPSANRYNIDGVTLFFVLSGFLIGRILISDMQSAEKFSPILFRFWTRRWLRTIPAYFATLLLLVTAYTLLGRHLPENTYKYIIFSQNIAWTHPGFFPEAWSLAVEEWFYLLLPLMFFFFLRATSLSLQNSAIASCLLMLLISTSARIYRISLGDIDTFGEWDSTIRKTVISRLDSLAFGVAGAYFSIYFKNKWESCCKTLAATGIALIIVDMNLQPIAAWRNHATLTIQPLAALCLLPFLSTWKAKPNGLTAAVTFISQISYSLYLLHHSFIHGVLLSNNTAVSLPSLPNAATEYLTYWILSIVFAWIFWRFIESPFLKLRPK